MSENKDAMDDRPIGSDLARVDANVDDASNYDEVPEITVERFYRAMPHFAGLPTRGRRETNIAPARRT